MLSYCCYQTQIFGMAGIADKDDVSGTRRDTQSLRYSEDREEWNGRKKFHVKIIQILNIRRFDNFFNKTIKHITKPMTNDMVDIM